MPHPSAPLRAGFRAIAVDQRGHGLSDKPDSGYAFDDVCGDLAALIDELKLERPVIAGHSWGGNVAIQLAADRPDLVSGVVLVDGGFLEISSFEGMTWERTEQLMAPPPLDGVQLHAFLASARSWPELGDLWDEQVQEIVLANFEVTPGGTIRPRLRRENHMKILRAMWEQKPSQLWARIPQPVLMIPARSASPDPRNKMWLEGKSRAIEQALRELRSARVVWMENTIHDVPLHRPAALAEAIIGFVADAG